MAKTRTVLRGAHEEEINRKGKRPLVGVWLRGGLYEEVRSAKASEPVCTMAGFVFEVFHFGWAVYQRVGSLKVLKGMEQDATAGVVTSKRISAERCALLAEALNLIVQRGNSAIIEAVERYLIEKAGRFGGPRK